MNRVRDSPPSEGPDDVPARRPTDEAARSALGPLRCRPIHSTAPQRSFPVGSNFAAVLDRSTGSGEIACHCPLRLEALPCAPPVIVASSHSASDVVLA